MADNYFLDMIENLRKNQEVLLYNNILKIDQYQTEDVIIFLQKEYEEEAIGYPYQAPDFDSNAALWAAKTIYVAAQLILYREHKESDLEALLPGFDQEITPSAIVSSDLCLRFLPDMLMQLKLIDQEDSLITILENILVQWHYSGVHYTLNKEQLDFSLLATNECVKQLYSNRIIEYKKIGLAQHSVFRELIAANLGMYSGEFWNDFKKLTEIDE